MYVPKMSVVFFFAPIRIGVPVNPIRAQFGSAAIRFMCSVELCDRCASSISTTIDSSVFSSPSEGAFLVSANSSSLSPFGFLASTSCCFWIITNTTPGPWRLSIALACLTFFAVSTFSPDSSIVWLSWSCSWVRSVTTTTLAVLRPGVTRSLRTRNVIVRLLPDPWVCQMIPPRRS